MKTTEAGQPIGWIKFWKPKDDWYALDARSRETYYNQYQALSQRAIEQGAHLVGKYKCRGQSDWERFEFWEFPRLEVLVEFTNALEEINHFLYFSENATFGRRYDPRLDPKSWVV